MVFIALLKNISLGLGPKKKKNNLKSIGKELIGILLFLMINLSCRVDKDKKNIIRHYIISVNVSGKRTAKK